MPSLGISYFNAADGFSLPMILLTGIVFFTGVLTMWELEHRVKEFYALYFLLVTGVFGLFMSFDLFFIFIWYDVSLFPMYLLIAVWGSTRKEYGAMKLTLYLLAGSALILPAIIYLHVAAGGTTFDITALMQPGTFSAFQQKLAFLLLFLGFGILAAVWPFHTWSPVGHVAAPTAVSMVHAGVLMKIGAFGVLRVAIFLCPEGWKFWAPLMATLAVIGIVYGALAALSQTDLKFVVGYSSVSHMGIVGLGLSTVTVDGLNGAVFQMFAHGIMTALFFSAIGYIYDRTHTKMIPELGGLSRVMPKASGYFILAAFTGIGVPCLASFWGELVVFIAAFKTYPVAGVLAVGALVIGALFMLRVVQRTFYGPMHAKYAHLRRHLLRPGDPAHDPGGGDRVLRTLPVGAVRRDRLGRRAVHAGAAMNGGRCSDRSFAPLAQPSFSWCSAWSSLPARGGTSLPRCSWRHWWWWLAWRR